MNTIIYLHKDKENSIKKGHPWIFPKAIAKSSQTPITGELVDIVSSAGEALGVGIYNEHSLYRVRVLLQGFEKIKHASLGRIINYRLTQALTLRQNLNLPNALTNAYRVFNSEADGLSGLTIDRFNQTTVVSSSAYWVEANKELISESIQQQLAGDLLWLTQSKTLTQEGWKLGQELSYQLRTQVLEAGIRYEIDFSKPQKTGLFLDQRENHQRIAPFAEGKHVLDLYCYTGGFALHAAKANARQVTAVDSSSLAIQQAKRNAELNGLSTINFIVDDARNYLAQAADYDLIILDPPKLIPSKQHLQTAKNYYRFLHREVFKAMRSGSLILTCNCSSAITAQEFSVLVSTQAALVGKNARILGVFGPASCHPTLATFPEGNYLTALFLAIV